MRSLGAVVMAMASSGVLSPFHVLMNPAGAHG